MRAKTDDKALCDFSSEIYGDFFSNKKLKIFSAKKN